MWTPVTLVLFMIIIMVIVPYLHLMLYISNHITPHIRSNITLAIPDTSVVDIPVVEVTSPPSRHAWMAAIEPMIRDKLLSDLVLPGTHSSSSYSLDPNGLQVDTSFITSAMVSLGFKVQATRWLQTQSIDVFQQLEEGIRALHTRVVAVNQRFFTHNGFLGEPLFSFLQQIRKFTDSYKREIVVVYLEDLKEVTLGNEVKVMTQTTRMELIDVISSILRTDLVPFSPKIPTIGEILDSNKNIILVSDLHDAELAHRHSEKPHNETNTGNIWPEFNTKVIKSDFTEACDIFLYLSDLLKRTKPPLFHEKMLFTFLTLSPNINCKVTSFLHSRLFLCMSLSVATIGGYIVGCYIYTKVNISNNSFCRITSRKRKHLCVIFTLIALLSLLYLVTQFVINTFGEPGCDDALLEMAKFANTESDIFPYSDRIYSDYMGLQGLNSALTNWLSKPSLYKVNTIFVDDFQTSNIVKNAIEYNRGSLRRKMMVLYIGSPLLGSRNIRSWFACNPSQISYLIVSHDEGKVVTWSSISHESWVTFEEGHYPMDSQIIIFAGAPTGRWFQLYSGNLHQWIDKGHDLYIRASENRNGRGVAYISDSPDVISSKCIPDQDETRGALNFTKWDAFMAAVNKNTKTVRLS